ncbi:MAG: FtsL-like putative cell division protein [Bacteroidales bacterium]|nr:FtsL-like putative cell division protein [Bacteroidales bacterium]
MNLLGNKDKKGQTQQDKFRWKSLINGEYFDVFFVKNIKIILIISVFLVLRISKQYYCEKQLAEIDQLQDSLKMVKYTYLTLSQDEMEMHRESQVSEKVSENGLRLNKSTTPPFIISK